MRKASRQGHAKAVREIYIGKRTGNLLPSVNGIGLETSPDRPERVVFTAGGSF